MSNSAYGWDPTFYDTVFTYWENTNLKEKYMVTDHKGNEKGFKKDGQFDSWYQNGIRETSGEYKYFERKYFTWINWYETGQRKEEIHYINNMKYGLNLIWHPDHSIKEIKYYKNNKLHGLSKLYNSGFRLYFKDYGYLIRECFYYEGVCFVIFHEDNRPTNIESPYYNEELNLWIEWKRRRGNYFIGKMKEDKRHGKWTTYAPTGEIITQDLYDNGVLVTVEE